MDIQELETHDQRGVNTAAALARAQLKYAVQIAEETRPGQWDPVLVAAILKAIVANYAAANPGKAHL